MVLGLDNVLSMAERVRTVEGPEEVSVSFAALRMTAKTQTAVLRMTARANNGKGNCNCKGRGKYGDSSLRSK